MGDIIPIGCVTYLDIPVETVLEAARDKLNTVVILGYDKDGQEYFASSVADGGTVLWLLERLKLQLLDVD